MLALPNPKGHGGARKGAGRKPRSGNQLKYRSVSQAMNSDEMDGVTPILVMLRNMKYYYDRAESFSEKLEELAKTMTPEDLKLGGDKLLETLRLIAKVGDFRLKAQECAQGAAPFCHPKLASIDFTETPPPSPEKPTALMTPKEAMKLYMANLGAAAVVR